MSTSHVDGGQLAFCGSDASCFDLLVGQCLWVLWLDIGERNGRKMKGSPVRCLRSNLTIMHCVSSSFHVLGFYLGLPGCDCYGLYVVMHYDQRGVSFASRQRSYGLDIWNEFRAALVMTLPCMSSVRRYPKKLSGWSSVDDGCWFHARLTDYHKFKGY